MAEKKEYVKLWMSYESYFEAYSAVEVGRLVLAMMKYRASGAEPEFSGSERFIWPAIKRDIDESIQAQDAASATNRENGKKGGRPSKDDKPNGLLENPKNPAGFEKSEKSQGQGQGQGQGQFTPPTPSSRGKRFSPPTVDEVREYCQERNNGIDAAAFVDFYTARGWMIGKTHMKDWKAAVRTWENRRKQEGEEDPYAKFT